MLIGDGAGRTVITGNRSNITKHGTPCSATVSAQGSGFMARDLTIENTAGPKANQAVAFLSNSNRSVLFRCEIKGYQDTLLAENHLQFYRDCEISGTIDIVFGDASAVFQNCVILARRPLGGQDNIITAQGRNGADSPTGFSFQGCNPRRPQGRGDLSISAARGGITYSRVRGLHADRATWTRSCTPQGGSRGRRTSSTSPSHAPFSTASTTTLGPERTCKTIYWERCLS
ncbi:hypothetical protein EJB05_16764, partial [Eragrostis curvula]